MTILKNWSSNTSQNASYPAVMALEQSMKSEQFRKSGKQSEVEVEFNMFDTSKILTTYQLEIFVNETQMKYIKKGKDIYLYFDNNTEILLGTIDSIISVDMKTDDKTAVSMQINTDNFLFASTYLKRDYFNSELKLYTKDWLGDRTNFKGLYRDAKKCFIFCRTSTDLSDRMELKLEFNLNLINTDTGVESTKKLEIFSNFFKDDFKLPNSNDHFYYSNFSLFDFDNGDYSLFYTDNLEVKVLSGVSYKIENEVEIEENIDLTNLPLDNNGILQLDRNIPGYYFGNLKKRNVKLTSFMYNDNAYCVGAFHEFIPILNYTIDSHNKPQINKLGQKEIINNYPNIPICKCKKSGAELVIENISRKEDIIIFSINKTDNNYKKFLKLNKIYNLPTNLNFNKNQLFYDIFGNINTYDSVDMFHIRLFSSDKHYKQSSSCILNKDNMLQGIIVGSEISNYLKPETENHDIYNNFNNLNNNKYNNFNNIVYMVPIKSIIRCLNKEKLKDLPFRIRYSTSTDSYYTSRDGYSSIFNIVDGDKSYPLNKFIESTSLTEWNSRIQNIEDFDNWEKVKVLNLIPLNNNAKFAARADGKYQAPTIDQIQLTDEQKAFANGAVIIVSRGITSFAYKRDFCKELDAKAMVVINSQEGPLGMAGEEDDLLSISIDNSYMDYFRQSSITELKINLSPNNFYIATEDKSWQLEYKYNNNNEYIKVTDHSTFNLLNIDDRYSSNGIIDRFNYDIDYSKPIYLKLIEYKPNDYFNQSIKEEKEIILDWNDISELEDQMNYSVFKLTNIQSNKSKDNNKHM